MNNDIRQMARGLRYQLGEHPMTKEICSESSFDVFNCILGKIAEYEFADDEPKIKGPMKFNMSFEKWAKMMKKAHCPCKECRHYTEDDGCDMPSAECKPEINTIPADEWEKENNGKTD